jgi:hypothetical protein
MTKPKYPNSFDRAKDERELMDEIYLLVGSEAYQSNRMHAIVGRSRPEVIAWYYAENPEFNRWVDRNIGQARVPMLPPSCGPRRRNASLMSSAKPCLDMNETQTSLGWTSLA